MRDKFKYDILENTEEGIVKIGEKEVYNLDSGEKSILRNWLSSDFNSKSERNTKYPRFSSALNVKESKQGGDIYKDCFAILAAGPSVVEKNQQEVYIVNGGLTSNWGVCGFLKNGSNFHKAVAGFCARRLIQSNVWNDKDEYMKPDDSILDSDDYKQWNNDCIIYSLFDNQSFQSSLRQIDYKGKKWDIINEFFWMSTSEMRTLAESINWIEMIDDLDNNELHYKQPERFVYTEIERIKTESNTFSKEALDLLDFANDLVKKSISSREIMHQSSPEKHLNCWDAGYAQLKLVWGEYFKTEFEEFKKLRKILADKLRPKVYEFGFLYE